MPNQIRHFLLVALWNDALEWVLDSYFWHKLMIKISPRCTHFSFTLPCAESWGRIIVVLTFHLDWIASFPADTSHLLWPLLGGSIFSHSMGDIFRNIHSLQSIPSSSRYYPHRLVYAYRIQPHPCTDHDRHQHISRHLHCLCNQQRPNTLSTWWKPELPGKIQVRNCGEGDILIFKVPPKTWTEILSVSNSMIYWDSKWPHEHSMKLPIYLSLFVIMKIQDIPIAYRIGYGLATNTFLHCRTCSVFRNVGVSKYTIQDMSIDIVDEPMTFQLRDITCHSSCGESARDV